MKRTNKILILLLVLVLLIGAVFAVLMYDGSEEDIKSNSELILNINPEEVTALSWGYDDVSFSFHKEDHWSYDEDASFPVSDTAILEMLSFFTNLQASFTITDVTDYAQYGLENPTAVIAITAGTQTYNIELGAFSTMDSQRYMSLGNGKVYMTEEDPFEIYNADLADVIEAESIPTLMTASSIAYTGAYEYTILKDKETPHSYADDDEFYAVKEGTEYALDTFKVNNYLSLAGSTPLGDFATYTAHNEDLSVYGMDTPDLTVTFTYQADGSEQECILHFSVNPAAAASEEETADAETTEEATTDDTEEIAGAYVRIGDSPIIYELTSTYYKNLINNASMDSMRHAEVVYTSFKNLTQLDVTLDNNEYSFTTQMSEETPVWYYEEEALDMSAIEDALKEIKAIEYTEAAPSLKEEIRFTAHLANEKYPQTTVSLYRYDGDYCLAVIDEKPVSLVDRSIVVELIEAVYDIVL